MIFWVREIAGWVLLVLGLAAFWGVIDLRGSTSTTMAR